MPTTTAVPRPSLDEYLRILRSAGPDTTPFADYANADALQPPFIRLMHATADFVDACRADAEVGYADAHDVLRIMVAMFPKPLSADQIADEVARFVVDLEGETEEAA